MDNCKNDHMIRDRRSTGTKKRPRSWHSGGVSCPLGHHCISESHCNVRKVKNQSFQLLSQPASSADVFCLLFCNSSMTADDSVTVSREKKMLRSGM